MNQRLIIILILAAGGMGIAYSTSGTIQIGPTSCIGLSCDAPDYSVYSVVSNDTVYSLPDSFMSSLYVGNDGHIISNGNNNNGYVLLNGTVVAAYSLNNSGNSQDIQQSTSGKYAVLVNSGSFPAVSIEVFRNNVHIQSIHLNESQFHSGGFLNANGIIGISPDGHYIGVIGEDTSGTNDRLIILRGS